MEVMMTLHEPYKPQKPTEPSKPSKTLKAGSVVKLGRHFDYHDLQVPEDDYEDEELVDLYGAQDRSFPKEFSHLTLDQVKVTVSADCYGHIEIHVKTLVDMPNPWYDKRMSEYKDSMKWHRKSLERYEEEMAGYQKALKEYKKAKIQELDEEKRRLENDDDYDENGNFKDWHCIRK
jgi:hypothetical protein